MKNIFIFIFTLSLLCSCNNHGNKYTLNNKDLINTDTCLNGFILIEYLGEIDHHVKSLLIRTDKKDTTYIKYSRDKVSLGDPYIRKIVLNEIIITNFEFKIIKGFIKTHNTKKEKICERNGYNSQGVLLIDKCDTLDYIVDRTDINYFKNLEDIVFVDFGNINNKLIKYFEYSRRIQEKRLEDR